MQLVAADNPNVKLDQVCLVTPVVTTTDPLYAAIPSPASFIARIIDQYRNNQKLTLKLPYDQYASPTNAWDIARAMFVLLRDNKSGIYHIGSTDYMNRVELALRVLQYFPDAEYDLQTLSTKELQQPAARPLLGGFVKMKFSNEYPDFLFGNVDSYLRESTAESIK